MEAPSTTSGGNTLIAQVIKVMSQRITSRILKPGDKLPSIRSCARTLKVSKTTVTDAYDHLVAERMVISRPRAGFYVADNPPSRAPLSSVSPRQEREIDPLWVSRESLELNSEFAKPGCGWLPADWMPEESIRRTLRMLSRTDRNTLMDYAPPQGIPSLRMLLAQRLTERGLEVMPDQILLTASATHSLDLLCRFLLQPGDIVILDDPSYYNFQALLRAHQVTVIGVPYTPAGPDLERFAQVLEKHNPRLYITNATFHNPTGASLSPVVSHRLLKLADQYHLTIIEDDVFADFERSPAIRLAAFDGLKQVVYTGSFTKTLSASVRCGFIVAPDHWKDDLTNLKVATGFSGSRMSSEVIHQMLKNNSYHKHMGVIRQRLMHSMDEAIHRLQQLGIEPWNHPQGGMFLWCQLPGGIDSTLIAKMALERGVILAPGTVFSPSHTWSDFLRFNVSQMEEKTYQSLDQILKVTVR